MVQQRSVTEITGRAVAGLSQFIHEGLERDLEPVRIARAGYALLHNSCSANAASPGRIVGSKLAATQRDDGGWSDVEETAWCLGYLAAVRDQYSNEVARASAWLVSQRLPCGAWGKTERDRPRIPVTGLLSALVPDAVEHHALAWLTSEWEKDLSSPVQLTYKGAFFLMSQTHPLARDSKELISRTIEYLCAEQNEDGGFGPWKGHPIGSDPWSTGVVLWGLAGLAEQVPEQVVQRSISWLELRQLPSGLWPYHYLDDGTSLALIGLSAAVARFQS